MFEQTSLASLASSTSALSLFRPCSHAGGMIQRSKIVAKCFSFLSRQSLTNHPTRDITVCPFTHCSAFLTFQLSDTDPHAEVDAIMLKLTFYNKGALLAPENTHGLD